MARGITEKQVHDAADAPEPVAVLASQLWEEALKSAQDEELVAVAADRQSLEQDRATLAAEREYQREEQKALQQLKKQEYLAAADREAQVRHLRAVEDRAHGEVDRARQEAKELRAQLRTLTRERASQEQILRQKLDEAVAKSAADQREAGLQRGRADALEKELTRLGNLPASLQDHLVDIGKSTKRSVTKKAATSPGKRAAKAKAPR